MQNSNDIIRILQNEVENIFPLFRATKTLYNDDILVKMKIRKDRWPRDSARVPNFTYELFRRDYYPDIPSRFASVYSTISQHGVKQYGDNVNVIFPQKGAPIYAFKEDSIEVLTRINRPFLFGEIFYEQIEHFERFVDLIKYVKKNSIVREQEIDVDSIVGDTLLRYFESIITVTPDNLNSIPPRAEVFFTGDYYYTCHDFKTDVFLNSMMGRTDSGEVTIGSNTFYCDRNRLIFDRDENVDVDEGADYGDYTPNMSSGYDLGT